VLLAAVLAVASFASDRLAHVRGALGQRWVEWRSPAPRVPVLASFRRDFDRGRVWSPEDVLAMLRRRPDAYLLVGLLGGGYPVGSPVLASVARRVDGWQAAIAAAVAAGEPLDAGRLCIDWRPDLVQKRTDGRFGTSRCGSLLDANVCGPEPCSAHPDNPCSRWHGDMERDWGPAGRFDPAWLLRTDEATWRAIADRYYDGEDFCSGAGHEWGITTDRAAICAESRPGARVVPYGKVDPRARRLRSVSGVGLDLRLPAAREWNARRLLSQLHAQGIDAGEPGCVLLAYKPGLWVHAARTGPGSRCPAPEANSWSGFETPDNAGRCWGGGVLPTPYGPGEFERAMNEQLRVVLRLMAAPAPPALQADGASRARYERIRFLTTERPATHGRIWWIWQPDVLASGRLVGDMDPQPTGLPGAGAAGAARPGPPR
jgi:hypothetical protein